MIGLKCHRTEKANVSQNASPNPLIKYWPTRDFFSMNISYQRACYHDPADYALIIAGGGIIVTLIVWWRAGLLGEMWEEIRS
jgi:hypothetical protein